AAVARAVTAQPLIRVRTDVAAPAPRAGSQDLSHRRSSADRRESGHGRGLLPVALAVRAPSAARERADDEQRKGEQARTAGAEPFTPPGTVDSIAPGSREASRHVAS